jgi:transposase
MSSPRELPLREDQLARDPELLKTPLTPEELDAPKGPPLSRPGSLTRYFKDRKQVQLKTHPTPIKDERQKLALQMRIQGAKTKVVAETFGVSEVTIRKWTREGIAKGLAEEIRAQIAERLLPKAARTYEDILSTSAEELAVAHKGHEVKLKAARDIAKGLGVLRPESQSTQRRLSASMDLDQYMALRESKAANAPASQEQVIEGEAISSPEAPKQAQE